MVSFPYFSELAACLPLMLRMVRYRGVPVIMTSLMQVVMESTIDGSNL